MMGRFPIHIFSLLLLFVLFPGTAQKKGYQPGYLITLEADTLSGWIKDRSPEPFVELYSRIRFRPEGKRRRQKLGPDEIRGYGVAGRVYESVRLREEASFLKFRYYLDPRAEAGFLRVVRREGPLTWYEKEFVHDDNNYLDFYPLFHLEGTGDMVRVTQGILGLKRKRLTAYFRDCPPLVEAVAGKQLSTTAEVYECYLSECGKKQLERQVPTDGN